MREFDHERHEGALAAWRELNRRVAKELDATGAIQLGGAAVIRRPSKRHKYNPAKVAIGWFERRVLRGEVKRRTAVGL